MRARTFTLSPLAVAISFACSAQIFAQEAVEPAAEKIQIDESKIEEIVVVGKFQQSLVDRIPVDPQELPFTLNTIDRDFLDNRNFARPIEALTTLPNIVRTEDRQGTGTTNFYSRGFDAPTLVDNRVQNNFRGSGARDDSFVERYEVLKGPASIASGPVGAGGIINTVTKTPKAERFTNLKLRADEFGSAGVEFDANVGEVGSDAVLLRVNGAYRDAKFDADETKRETMAIRPVAIFNIGEATSVRTSVAYTEINSNPNSGFPLTDEGEIPTGVDTDTFTGFLNGEAESKDLLYEAEVQHEFLDNLKLTVRGSKQKTDFEYQNTGGLYDYRYDSGDIYAWGSRGETESEATFFDAQLGYQTEFWGQDQDFVVGVAYDKRSFERQFSTSYSWEVVDHIGDPHYGYDEYQDLYTFSTVDAKLNSVFAEAAIRPTDSVTIVAGLRYDELEQISTRRGSPSEYDDSEFTVRLGASYAASDDLNLYASFAQAFVPQFGIKRGDARAKAETSNGIEIGAKGSAFGGRMSYQAGIFSTDREDVEMGDPSNGADEFFVVRAGDVNVQGVEFSSNTSLTDALNLAFNIGYTNIDLSDEDIANGLSKPVFPEITGSLYVDYEVQSGGLQGLTVGGGFRYVGEKEGRNRDWDSYTIADLNFSYPVTDSLDVSFDILNVTDERYIENTFTNGVNSYTYGAVLGAPRTVAFTINWKL